jgi:hypothetical protein
MNRLPCWIGFGTLVSVASFMQAAPPDRPLDVKRPATASANSNNDALSRLASAKSLRTLRVGSDAKAMSAQFSGLVPRAMKTATQVGRNSSNAPFHLSPSSRVTMLHSTKPAGARRIDRLRRVADSNQNALSHVLLAKSARSLQRTGHPSAVAAWLLTRGPRSAEIGRQARTDSNTLSRIAGRRAAQDSK